MNQESKGKIKEGNKEEKEAKGAWSSLDFSRGLFSPTSHLIRKLQPKFQEIWGIFGDFGNFCVKNRLFLYMHCAPCAALRIGSSKLQMACSLDLSWEIMNFGSWKRNLGELWVPKRSKNMQKMTSLPLFWHTGSSFGRIHFWRGKWTPIWKIPLGLDSRQVGLSNKPTWAQFGWREVPQR